MDPVSQKPLNCVSPAPQFVVAPTAALRERPAAVLEAIAVAAGAPFIARRFQRRADDPIACNRAGTSMLGECLNTLPRRSDPEASDDADGIAMGRLRMFYSPHQAELLELTGRAMQDGLRFVLPSADVFAESIGG